LKIDHGYQTEMQRNSKKEEAPFKSSRTKVAEICTTEPVMTFHPNLPYQNREHKSEIIANEKMFRASR
jgi:hypothetical protein